MAMNGEDRHPLRRSKNTFYEYNYTEKIPRMTVKSKIFLCNRNCRENKWTDECT